MPQTLLPMIPVAPDPADLIIKRVPGLNSGGRDAVHVIHGRAPTIPTSFPSTPPTPSSSTVLPVVGQAKVAAAAPIGEIPLPVIPPSPDLEGERINANFEYARQSGLTPVPNQNPPAYQPPAWNETAFPATPRQSWQINPVSGEYNKLDLNQPRELIDPNTGQPIPVSSTGMYVPRNPLDVNDVDPGQAAAQQTAEARQRAAASGGLLRMQEGGTVPAQSYHTAGRIVPVDELLAQAHQRGNYHDRRGEMWQRVAGLDAELARAESAQKQAQAAWDEEVSYRGQDAYQNRDALQQANSHYRQVLQERDRVTHEWASQPEPPEVDFAGHDNNDAVRFARARQSGMRFMEVPRDYLYQLGGDALIALDRKVTGADPGEMGNRVFDAGEGKVLIDASLVNPDHFNRFMGEGPKSDSEAGNIARQAGHGFVGGLQKAWQGARAIGADTLSAFTDVQPYFRKDEMRARGEIPISESFARTADEARQNIRSLNQEERQHQQDYPVQSFLGQQVAMAASTAPDLLAMAFNPGVGVGMMAARAGGEQYAAGVEEGQSPQEAASRALASTLANALLLKALPHAPNQKAAANAAMRAAQAYTKGAGVLYANSIMNEAIGAAGTEKQIDWVGPIVTSLVQAGLFELPKAIKAGARGVAKQFGAPEGPRAKDMRVTEPGLKRPDTMQTPVEDPFFKPQPKEYPAVRTHGPRDYTRGEAEMQARTEDLPPTDLTLPTPDPAPLVRIPRQVSTPVGDAAREQVGRMTRPHPVRTANELRMMGSSKLKEEAARWGVAFDAPSTTIPRILDAQERWRLDQLTDKQLYEEVVQQRDRLGNPNIRAGNREANIQTLMQVRNLDPTAPAPTPEPPAIIEKLQGPSKRQERMGEQHGPSEKFTEAKGEAADVRNLAGTVITSGKFSGVNEREKFAPSEQGRNQHSEPSVKFTEASNVGGESKGSEKFTEVNQSAKDRQGTRTDKHPEKFTGSSVGEAADKVAATVGAPPATGKPGKLTEEQRQQTIADLLQQASAAHQAGDTLKSKLLERRAGKLMTDEEAGVVERGPDWMYPKAPAATVQASENFSQGSKPAPTKAAIAEALKGKSMKVPGKGEASTLRVEDAGQNIVVLGSPKSDVSLFGKEGLRGLWSKSKGGWVFPRRREAEVRAKVDEVNAQLSAANSAQPAPAAQTTEPPKAAPAVKPPKGYSRDALESKLLDHYREIMGGTTRDDLTAQQMQDAGHDLIGSSKFTFHKQLPDEVRKFIEGRPEARRLFRVTDDPTAAHGLDAMHALGGKYWDLAETAAKGRAGAVADAKEAARTSPDPSIQFLNAVHDALSAPASERVPFEAKKPSEIPAGSRFEFQGEKFVVTEDEGGFRILKDGDDFPEVPLDYLDAVPVDKGTLKTGQAPEPVEAKPAPTSDTGVFGQEILRPATGKNQGTLFHEPVKVEGPAESAEDAKIRAKFNEGEAATGKLFDRPSAADRAVLSGGGNGSGKRPMTEKGFAPRAGSGRAIGRDQLNPIKMPELVRLARDLIGEVPDVKTLRSALGYFMPGGRGRIAIDANTAKDPGLLAAVLGHEIGHLVDYLPDQTMARGNLLARTKSLKPVVDELGKLKAFMGDVFGGGPLFDGEPTNRQLREELLKLSAWWRPLGPEGWTPYRRSSKELYADALSVLLNSPGDLEARAPRFYETLLKNLDAKPDVLKSYLTLQDLLAGESGAIARLRRRDMREAFGSAHDIIHQRAEERRQSTVSVKARVEQLLIDRMSPLYSIIGKTARAGKVERAKALAAKYTLDEMATAFGSDNHLMLGRVHNEVTRPVEEAGMSMEDLGEYLFLKRVKNERKEIANPWGFTPETAGEQIENLKAELGPEKFAKLEKAVDTFHGIVFESVERAVEVGTYNRQHFETALKPNKGNYATFSVLDHLEDRLPSTIREQVGTFKDIQNPFIATLMKTATLNRVNALQEAKNEARDFLRKYAPEEMGKGTPIRHGMREPKPPTGKENLIILEDGNPIAYPVDPYVAKAFSLHDVGALAQVGRVMSAVTYKPWHALFVTYNPGWHVYNLIKDFRRNYKNTPVPLRKLVKAYFQTAPAAWRRARGKSDPLIEKMLADRALDTPFARFDFEHEIDSYDRLLEQHGLDPKRPKARNIALRVLHGLSSAVETGGVFAETWAKTAVYQALESSGMKSPDVAYRVRNYAGTPNVRRRGLATPVTNSLFMYSNIWAQGLRADAEVARDPRTRVGFAVKTILTSILPRLATYAAGAGMFGAAIQTQVNKIPGWMKINYNTIPLGLGPAGADGARKVAYLALPEDETSRLLGSVFTAFLEADKSNALATAQDVFGVSTRQLPGLSPPVDWLIKWGEFASGINPKDSFRGRDIVGRDEWNAGGWYAGKQMLAWQLNQLGVLSVLGQWMFGDNKHPANSRTEKIISNVPGLNRLIRFSDRGEDEKTWDQVAVQDAEAARFRLNLPTPIRDALHERYRLNRIYMLGDGRLSDKQMDRRQQLNEFYGEYLETSKKLKAAVEAKNGAGEASLRKELDRLGERLKRIRPESDTSMARELAELRNKKNAMDEARQEVEKQRTPEAIRAFQASRMKGAEMARLERLEATSRTIKGIRERVADGRMESGLGDKVILQMVERVGKESH